MSHTLRNALESGQESRIVQIDYWPVIISPVHFVYFLHLENKLIGYADDFTFTAAVPFPSGRVTVAESLIRDVGRVSEWCDLWILKNEQISDQLIYFQSYQKYWKSHINSIK